MTRVLLLLPTATYRAPDFVAAATALGVEVVVGSEHRQAMARSMDDRALVVPLADPPAAVAAILELHRRSPVAAVVAVDDQGVLVAAMASEALGLRHNPPAAVAATRDKAAMRAALAAAGVAQPEHRVVALGDDVAAAADAVGLPCVVKPVSLSGSSGVIRADTPDDAERVARRIRAILAERGADEDGPLLVERFIPGEEVAVEGVLRDGVLEVLATFDKPDPLEGPYFEETLYVTPSRLAPGHLARVHATVADAAGALGLVEGPVHAEARVDVETGRVALLEVAARSIGGLCSRALRFGAGISLEEVLLRHALDLPAPAERESVASGVMMLPIPRSGVLDGVGGIDDALAVPGVVGLEITATRGRPVRALPEGDRYLGFAFARGATPEEVERSLRGAHGALEVRISDPEDDCDASVG